MLKLTRDSPQTASNLDAEEIVRISAIAAIATDADDHILACNDPALELLGYQADRLVGRRFSEALQPRDIFSNPLGYDSSLFVQFLENGSPLRNFQCNLRTSCGNYQRTGLSVVTVLGPKASQHQLVYMLWPVLRRRKADEVIDRLLNSAGFAEGSALRQGGSVSTGSVLTGRQVEVLRLVAGGQSTEAIADKLCISSETVRNHIRNILTRLGVHSRVEAVSLAYKQHLI